MNRIIKIGMDVHSTNYTLCAMEPTIGAEDRVYGEVQVAPDYKEVICFIESLKMKLSLDNEYSIECGYEAGCLGYTLYHQLVNAGINQAQTQVLSVIPSTASSFLRILATNLSRSSAVNSSSPCLKVTVKAILFMVGGIGMPS